MAPYALDPSLSRVRRVMDFVDVDSEKWRQYAATARPGLRWLYKREARLVLEAERRFAHAFDASTFVSAPEAGLFHERVPDARGMEVIPNGVDCDYFDPDRGYANPYEGAPALVFTGAMNYAANVDAVQWFAHEVFPGVRSKVDRARFYIVGHRPTPAVRRLERLPGVVVTGSVEDVRPYLAHARAVVAPLRIARGIQNKVLEALAMDKRILATPQAFDGIEGYPLSRDSVNEMPAILEAAAIRYLAEDAAACDGTGREFVMRHYSWQTSISKMAALLAGKIPESRQPSHSQIAGRSA